MAEAEAAHIAEGERLLRARYEMQKIQKDIAKRTESARLASLHLARQADVAQKIMDLEAVETETITQRLAATR